MGLRSRGGAHDDGSRVLGGRLLDIIEVHLLSRSGLIRDGQAVEHDVGVRHGRLGRFGGIGRAGGGLVGLAALSWFHSSVARSLGGIERCGRCLVDVARVAIISVVVVIAPDGALGQGVVIEVHRSKTALVLALVLDAASVADKLSASRHRGSHHVHVDGLKQHGGREMGECCGRKGCRKLRCRRVSEVIRWRRAEQMMLSLAFSTIRRARQRKKISETVTGLR